MLRRLHHDQPESFEFTPANRKWAEAQLTKYPDGREASAVIALLWRAQEQEGWLSRPAIEHVAGMCGLAYIRALEVATFYFMFHLQPVGSVAHIQICGTTSCMICGAEDLIGVCKEKIAPLPHQVSEDGKFSWEEVECLGACSNAPMAQIGKDYYEDLTAGSLASLLDAMATGEVPRPGSQIGRFASEPADGKTVLLKDRVNAHNASVDLALEIGDTLKRIDGTEQPLRMPWNPVMDSAARVPPPVNDDLMPPSGGGEGETRGLSPPLIRRSAERASPSRPRTPSRRGARRRATSPAPRSTTSRRRCRGAPSPPAPPATRPDRRATGNPPPPAGGVRSTRRTSASPRTMPPPTCRRGKRPGRPGATRRARAAPTTCSASMAWDRSSKGR